MKAEELFKKKAEVALALDELGVDYPKIKSGASAGKPTQTFKELCVLFDEHGEEDEAEAFVDPVLNMKTVAVNRKAFGFR